MTSKYYEAENHIFMNETSSIVRLKAGSGQYLQFDSSISINGVMQYIINKEDFPEPVADVITLEPDKAYVISGTVDLEGSRLVMSSNTALLGITSEISFLTSTGLGIGVPFITSTTTFNLQNLTIHDVDTLFACDGDTGTEVMDSLFFNTVNIPNIGVIKDFNNWIVVASAFINSAGMVFDGNFGTISFNVCIFTNFVNGTSITVAPGCNISRRFKIRDSSMVTTGTGVAIDFSTSATVPNQGYKLIEMSFTGGTATHLTGVTAQQNQTDFFRNSGIDNSAEVGGFHINTPATTTPLVVNVWKKLAGTTNAASESSKFSHADNLLTYTGSITKNFTINYSVSLSSSNSKDIEIGVSVNGADPELESISLQTTDSAGKIGYQGLSYFHVLHEGDTLELYTRNITDSSNVTASRMNITVV